MKLVALMVACSLAADTLSEPVLGNWWQVDDKRTFVGANGAPVQTTVLTVDLTRARLRVVSVPFEAGKRPGGAELSLRQFADVLATKPEYRNREWIAVNGGFSSYSADVPLGLLVVTGKVYSTVAKERPRFGQSNSRSEYAQYRWSGILCENAASGAWEILAIARYTPGSCRQALQAGPVPVQPPRIVGISPNEVKETAYVRTVLCLIDASQVRVITTHSPVNLYPLAQWLSRPEVAAGLGCQSALNLSGDTSSGIVIQPARGTPVSFGEGSFPLPTALIFEGRTGK
jgi:hypothetical protein